MGLREKKMRGSNFRVLTGAAVYVCIVASIPGAAASTTVCLESANGMINCVKRLSLGARIGIGIGISLLLSAILTMIFCLCLRSRRSRHEEAIAQVYQVEPSQIQGPLPTTYAASFDPRSPNAYPRTPEPAPAHSHDGHDHHPNPMVSPANMPLPVSANFPASGKSDTYPATLMRYGTAGGALRPPQTAPVNHGTSSNGYPFHGYSSNASPNHPHTAYHGGFPKPLYTGQSAKRDEWPEVHKDTV